MVRERESSSGGNAAVAGDTTARESLVDVAVLVPTRLDQALDALHDDPARTVIAGGTDLMVEMNAGRRRPADVVSLRRVEELRRWRVEGGELVIGAGVTYATLQSPELAALAPALAQAARTVGSPQVRATGTIGGNLATGSPAGDTLPVLAALDARIEVASRTTRRLLAWDRFLLGPKQTALRPGELILAVRVPVASGPQEFLKIGVRNAMVISVASCALVVDHQRRRVTCALGSVGPVPVRSRRSEAWLSTAVDWATGHVRQASVAERFGWHMAAAARPIDDHRATAAYRRHAAGVLAQRAVERTLTSGTTRQPNPMRRAS
jgi:CO/xanthine dehydrogenase FAD-binding subunit